MLSKLYVFCCYLKKRDSKLFPFSYKLCKLVVNLYYPVYHYFDRKKGVNESNTIIVSLTSFPDRINNVWKTINTIMNQTEKPKKIILWLSEEQFSNHKLPRNLTRLCKRGLEIKYCDDLKPHKKYYYSMIENPNDLIVTIDDDTFYPKFLLENLLKGYRKFDSCIICTISHNFVYENDNTFSNYNLWNNKKINHPSLQIVPIGCGGVLYPPNSLDKDVFDKKKIMNIALYTDDLWLKCMSVKIGTKCYNASDYQLNYFNNLFVQRDGLWKKNTRGENRNDKVWSSLMDLYPNVKNKLIKSKE